MNFSVLAQRGLTGILHRQGKKQKLRFAYHFPSKLLTTHAGKGDGTVRSVKQPGLLQALAIDVFGREEEFRGC